MENSKNSGSKGTCPVVGHSLERGPTPSGLSFQAVFENSFNGIIVINSDGIVEHFNPAAAAMFGYDRREVVGKNVSILLNSFSPQSGA